MVERGKLYSQRGFQQRPTVRAPATPAETPKENFFYKNKIYLIVGAMIIIVGILLFVLLYNPEEDFSGDYSSSGDFDEDYIPEITSGGCDLIGLTYNSQSSYSCFDEENDLVKIYLSRSSENVLLDRIDFVLFSNESSTNYSSNYGLAPGGGYLYQIDFTEPSLDHVEITPVILENDEEVVCSKIYMNTIQSCQLEDFSSVDFEPDYFIDEDLNVVLVNDTNGSESILGSSQGFLDFFANKPQKKILNFSIDSVIGEIDELRHRIFVRFLDNRSFDSLTPSITISENATIRPISRTSINFTNPVTYTITASDNSTQQYVVYVSHYTEEEEYYIPSISPFLSVELYPIESSNSSSRQVKYFVSGEKNASSCSLYSENYLLVSNDSILTNANNSFSVSNLLVGPYFFIVTCTDTDSLRVESNIVSFNVSSFGTSITKLGGITAGVWGTNLSAAKQMASLNNNFYIINYGNLESCSICKSMQEEVFGTPEFMSWASQNGIAMIYANSDYDILEPTKTVLSRYVVPLGQSNISIPFIVIVGGDSDNALASFTYWAGRNINGIVAARNPESFMSIVKSYTGKYSSIIYPPSVLSSGVPVNNNAPAVEVDDCADGSCSVGNVGTTPTTPTTPVVILSPSVSVPLGEGAILTNEYQTFTLPTPVKHPKNLVISAIRLVSTSSTCSVSQKRIYSDGTNSSSGSFSVGSSGKVYTDDLGTNKTLVAIQIKTSTFCKSNMVKVTNITVNRFQEDIAGTIPVTTIPTTPSSSGGNYNIDWTLPSGSGSFSESISTSGSVAGVWTLDIAAARALAKQNGKFYILNVGATSGCSWCDKLKSGVYNTYAFHEWARKNGIPLVYANYYPCRSGDGYNTQLTSCPAVVKEVSRLYNYDAFPSVFIISGSGTGKAVIGSFVARSGYNTLNGYMNALKNKIG